MNETHPLGLNRRFRRLFLRMVLLSAVCVGSGRAQIIDTVIFGEPASESAHGVNAPQTQVISGGLGQPARKMAWDATDTIVYEGGYVEFTAQCDPLKLNYVTLKLWGSDTSATASGILLLYQVLDGQLLQVGYRDQQASEFAPLAWAARLEMAIPRRFYYTTIPLPLSLTQGRKSVQLRVVGAGMNSNGSLPVYRAYVHAGAYFEPAPGDPQGAPPGPAPVRPSVLSPMQVMLNKARQTTIANMNSWLANNNGDLYHLAAGYNVLWTPAYQNPLVPPRVVAFTDSLVQGYFANPGNATSGAGPDHGWGGAYGDEAALINHIGTAGFGSALDEVVDLGDPAGPATRRVLWGKAFAASRNNGQFSRRGPTTNQSIISDRNFYNANRALLTINSPLALTEEHAKRFLLESVGLLPWMGSDNQDGTPSGWMGSAYYLVTPAGLTKEDGYVSAYGEVYDISTGYYAQTGDERFRVRSAEMLKARSYFRYPMVDEDGYRSFRMVGPLDWRSHEYFPFDQAYGERGTRLTVAPATRDPAAIGYAWQMFEDGQSSPFGTDFYAAQTLETFVNQPDSGQRLPMTEGQPDFAWADVDNGVVAIKRGEELTWIEPYWQSRSGLHSIARTMQITPTAARLATVRSDLQFPWKGSWASKVDGTGWNGAPLETPHGTVHQGYLNDKILLPVPPATAPAGTTREEFISRASFYATRYGRYLVGINMDKANAYELKTPPGFSSAMDLITRQVKSGTVTVAPFSAVVLDLGVNVEPNPVPNSPKYLSATSVPGAVAVVWETSGGATSYRVKRATSPAGPFTTVATGLGASYPLRWGFWPSGNYFDTATTTGSTYYYKVSAVNAAGESYDSPTTTGSSPGASVATVNTLPAPWKNVNFSGSGSASYDATTSTFTLKGGGGDIWNTADGGHFVYQAVLGDGDVVARLTSLGGAYKTGVMIRASLAANAPEASMVGQTNQVIAFQRASVGGSSIFFGGDVRPDPVWLKIERRGKNMTVYYAPDVSGAPGAWVNRGIARVEAGAVVYAGIITTSGTPAFDNLSVAGFGPPTATVPDSPANVTASPGNGAVTLAWTPASGAATYTVKRASSAAGPFTTVVASGLNALAYTHSGLANGTGYFYVITGVNANGESAPSAVVSATPAAVPAVPGNLVVTPSGSQAVLTWSAASGASSYTVLRSLDGSTWVSLGSVTGTTFTDTNLASGQGYFYAITAVNGAGSSASTASVGTVTAPVAPRLFDAAGSDTQARLTWEAAAGASSYRIARSTASGGPYTTVASGVTSLGYVDANLANKGTYFYVVAASNNAGESPLSAEMKLGWGTGLLGRYFNNTGLSGTPALSRVDPVVWFDYGQLAPEGINADFSAQWTGKIEAPATGTYTIATGPADDYLLITINGVGVTKYSSGTVNLVAGQKYDISVDFKDTGGAAYLDPIYWSSASVPRQPIPTSRLQPAVLQINRATGGTATANGGSGNEGPAQAFDGNTATKWLGAIGALQYQFAGSAAWAVNEYRVTSANDVPTRDPRDWQFQGFRNGAWTTLDTRTGQTFSARFQTLIFPIANTTAYTAYRLNITANSGAAGGATQLSELALYVPDVQPAPPSGITATPGDQKVELSWPAVSGAAGYTVKRSSYSGGPYALVRNSAASSSFTDDRVANGRTYFYVVSSTTSTGESENSAQASVTLPLLPVPAVPTGLAANAGDAFVDISWATSPNAASYVLQRSQNSASGYTTVASGNTATSYHDLSVANGATYYYTVAAVNTSGTSPVAGPISATPRATPDTAAPAISFQNNANKLHLATSGAGRTYQLQRSYTLAADSWVSIGPPQQGGGALDFTDTVEPPQPKVFYRLLIGP